MKQDFKTRANPSHGSDAATLDHDPPIATNDTPKPGWFKVDNDFYRSGLAAEIGSDGVAVYQAIRLHANQKTGQAWPSYKTIQNLTGLSRTTIVKCVKKLKRLGLIRVENRKDQFGGRTSNMYTVLDISGGRNDARNGASGGASDVSGAVQGTDGGSTSGGSGPVRPTNVPRSQGVSEQHSGKHTKRESEEKNLTHHQQEIVDDVGSLSSSEEWVTENRKLTTAERSRLKRSLALTLLKIVVPDFLNPKRYVKGLDASQIDRLGACLLMLSVVDNEYYLALRSPAGFVRSMVDSDEWHESEDLEEKMLVWNDFSRHIVDVLRGSVTAYQSCVWLAESGLDTRLQYELSYAGLVYKEDETLIQQGDIPEKEDAVPSYDANGTLVLDDEEIPF